MRPGLACGVGQAPCSAGWSRCPCPRCILERRWRLMLVCGRMLLGRESPTDIPRPQRCATPLRGPGVCPLTRTSPQACGVSTVFIVFSDLLFMDEETEGLWNLPRSQSRRPGSLGFQSKLLTQSPDPRSRPSGPMVGGRIERGVRTVRLLRKMRFQKCKKQVSWSPCAPA